MAVQHMFVVSNSVKQSHNHVLTSYLKVDGTLESQRSLTGPLISTLSLPGSLGEHMILYHSDPLQKTTHITNTGSVMIAAVFAVC